MVDSAPLGGKIPFVGGIACAFLFVVLHRVIYNRLEAESLDALVGGTLMPLFSALAIGLLAGHYAGTVLRRGSSSTYFLSGLFLTVLVEFVVFALTTPRGLDLATLATLGFVVFATVSVSILPDENSLLGTVVLVFVALSAVWVLVLAFVYYLLPVLDVLENWRPWSFVT